MSKRPAPGERHGTAFAHAAAVIVELHFYGMAALADLQSILPNLEPRQPCFCYCRAIATFARARLSSSESGMSFPEISAVTWKIVPVNSKGGP
jgi:hypothetical protein